MDSPQAVTHVSLCAGYGGIDLGLKRAIRDLRTIAFCEVEAFAVANLVSKMEAGRLDAAPVWTNLKTLPWGKFRGCVDVLSGGYPCQPFSAAGKRLGDEDPRHLWPWISNGIVSMQPQVCFFENVEGHVSLGLEDVLLDLQRIGYRCTFGVFSAAEVGAPHQRKRLFILAHNSGVGIQGRRPDWVEESFAYAGQGLPLRGGDRWPSRPSQEQFRGEPPRTIAKQIEPAVGGDAHGCAGRMDYAKLCISGDSRVDELRLLGNGVVPATAERAFRVLAGRLFA